MDQFYDKYTELIGEQEKQHQGQTHSCGTYQQEGVVGLDLLVRLIVTPQGDLRFFGIHKSCAETMGWEDNNA